MTTKALIKKSELMRLAAVAKQNNITIEVEAEGYRIRLNPHSAAPPETAEGKPEDFTSLAEWQAWRDRERARAPLGDDPATVKLERARRRGPGGYPVVDDPNHALRQWYDRLGFDPHTMGQEDMERLQENAQAEWEKSIPGTPLGKREKSALAQLADFGPGKMVEWTKIKNCGPDTEDRLKARGFIETRPSNKWPDRIAYYVLTTAGYEAWNNLGKSPEIT